jgi:hypothetical protein
MRSVHRLIFISNLHWYKCNNSRTFFASAVDASVPFEVKRTIRGHWRVPHIFKGTLVLFRVLLFTLLLGYGPLVLSKPWVDAPVFLMNEAQLKAVFPGLHRASAPRMGARGVRSQWSSGNALVAGHPFETVLYAKSGVLRRIEHIWSVKAAPCLARAVFDDVVSELNSALGRSNATDAGFGEKTGQQSAIWLVGGTDLIAYLHETDMQCTVRLVNKPHSIKDVSEL